MISLVGRLKRITYYNPDTHYLIAQFDVEDPAHVVGILGFLPDPNPGEKITITGQWQTHPKYGEQFKFHAFDIMLPDTAEAIRLYLQSGMIKGIARKTADRLVSHFQDDTLAVIENHPHRLTEVRGIGETTAAHIADAWREHHQLRSLMRLLQKIGAKPSYAAALFRKYGADAVIIIQEDPFRLMEDFPRFGFEIADLLLRHSGIELDPADRAVACVKHLLLSAADQGHTFVDRERLLSLLEKRFGIDYAATREALDELLSEKWIAMGSHPDFPDGEVVYTKPLYDAESEIAAVIHAMCALPEVRTPLPPQGIIDSVLAQMAVQLSDDQLAVLESMLSHRIAVVTGGPGTGKTTLVRSLTAVLTSVGRGFMLSAPTGRAARRLAEITGKPSATLHKLLGYNAAENLFTKNRDNPLQTETLIVDEASMIDVLLMRQLLEALPLQAQLYLVGDAFQLPSVGPGSVLSDLIRSDCVPVFSLREIFRQAKESPIIRNAHRIRDGLSPELSDGSFKDGREFVFVDQSDALRAAREIVAICKDAIPRQFGLNPIKEVQVLTPMHKGNAGTQNLNHLLQQALNPIEPTARSAATPFRAGDKVIHLKNNYQKEIFNGDIGIVTGVENDRSKLSVAYEDRLVEYDFSETDELALGYAISIHKSQGSEYPAVVVPILTEHYAMLYRNLLYTAITRGKRLVVLVGSRKAVAVALRNIEPRKRLTSLAHRLRSQDL